MSPQSPITINGTINADGSLDLAQPHGLPPGPVRVSLERIGSQSKSDTTTGLPRVAMPLPDPPILDTAISAPCDLPLTGPLRAITPLPGNIPLPDAIDETDFIR